jgi:glycosyltransferase involved in cell wall biosynthesis
MSTPHVDQAEAPPLVSIVIPALNEELTIHEFVEWCWQGLSVARVSGEILIVDSSTDRTGDIAEAAGARVLRVPKRGLGRAYIDALPHIKGRYVIMGDCDLTYDFRQLDHFVAKLTEGFEFVMGSRFRGYIEPGAMPRLHRYFGTPITTWVLNAMYGTHYSDIHCGMRALSADALSRLKLTSQGWEYASEMVLKAARLGLRTCEVPVRFYKDREGRVSHHKRAGWLSPWKAGWDNARVMFQYAPDFFLAKPGWVSLAIGALLTASLAAGPYHIGYLGISLHWMLFGVTLTTVGYSAVQLAILARVFYNFDPAYSERVSRTVTYNRGTAAGVLLGAVGFALNMVLLVTWFRSDLLLKDLYHPGIFGLLLIILGFQTFTFTLLLHMLLHERAAYAHSGEAPGFPSG